MYRHIYEISGIIINLLFYFISFSLVQTDQVVIHGLIRSICGLDSESDNRALALCFVHGTFVERIMSLVP